MINIKTIQGIVFDYGGTIDSNGLHWAEVIWQAYQAEAVPVTKDVFRQAYVYAERTMGQLPLVKPEHTFADMMRIKTDLQIEWLRENRYLSDNEAWPGDAIHSLRGRPLRRALLSRCWPTVIRWSWFPIFTETFGRY